MSEADEELAFKETLKMLEMEDNSGMQDWADPIINSETDDDLLMALMLQTEEENGINGMDFESSSLNLVYDNVDPEIYEDGDQLVETKFAYTPLFGSPKNSEITGTFNSNAFQMEFQMNGEEQDSMKKGHDPLSVSLLSMLGCHCVPQIGVYGEDYAPVRPLVLIQLPFVSSLARKQIPTSLVEQLEKSMETNQGDPKIDFFIEIHGCPPRKPFPDQQIDPSDPKFQSELNMMFHAWMFPQTNFFESNADTQANVLMGVFEPMAIRPLQQDHSDVDPGNRETMQKLSSMPFNRLEEREVCIHSNHFSPANAQILLTFDRPAPPRNPTGNPAAAMSQSSSSSSFVPAPHSFFAAGCDFQTNRAIVTFHAIAATEQQETDLESICASSLTLFDLINKMGMDDNWAYVAKRLMRTLIPYVQ